MDSTQSFIEKGKTRLQILAERRARLSIEGFQHKPLIELTNFCNDKGYEVLWTKDLRALLYYKGDFMKEGKKKYNNEIDLQVDVYNQIYKKCKKL